MKHSRSANSSGLALSQKRFELFLNVFVRPGAGRMQLKASRLPRSAGRAGTFVGGC